MAEFRWRFTDDGVGDRWTDWHVVGNQCVACCCNGPVDGEHCTPAAYYDDEGFIEWSAHSWYDPADPEPEVEVERR